MYLIFDIATSGKPLSWKAPMTDLFNWPRVMQISWIILGEDYKPIKDLNFLIKPDGYTFKESEFERHEIDPAKLEESGEPIKDVIDVFNKSIEQCKYVFVHNKNYKESVLGAEALRLDMKNPFNKIETYCLMEEGTFWCKIPNKRGGYKWPSLQEMHTIFFKKPYGPQGNARADVIASSRCFIALAKVNAFEDIFEAADD